MSLEHILRRSLIFFVWKIKGLKTKSIYEEQISREFWSKEQWEKYKNNLAKQFLKHCYQNVPYYKKLFDNNNLDIKNGNIIPFYKL